MPAHHHIRMVCNKSLPDWAAGTMKSRENVVVVVGLDTFPETLLKLFNGENFGKLVLQVAKE